LVKSALHFPDGPWKSLLEKAYWLMDSIKSDGFTLPRWSLGGGTVNLHTEADFGTPVGKELL
jgi:hypothetical protein